MGALAIKPAGTSAIYTPNTNLGPTKVVVYSDHLVGFTEIWDERFKRIASHSVSPGKRGAAGFSLQSQTRLRKVIDLYFMMCETKMIYNPVTHRQHPFISAFITLTIPANRLVNRKQSNSKLLNTFLTFLRAHGGIYVWKSEQTKRNQVHYHILYSRFIEHDKVRREWNRILKRNNLLSQYAQQHGHFNAPSTETKGVYTRAELKKYLAKYISKSTQCVSIKGGRTWGASTILSKIEFFTFYEDEAPDLLATHAAKIYDYTAVWPNVTPNDLPPHLKVKFDNWLTNARTIANP